MVIVLDYERSKLERFFPFTIHSKEEIEIKALEALVERKEKELEDAQMKYARETDKDEKLTNLTIEQRKELKAEQKKRMQEAAAQLAKAEEELTSKEGRSSKSHLHRRSAERILRLCRENGGVYIKVGQHLANLDYLIPQEYIDVLSSLFNDAPRSKYEDVCKVIEEELGYPVESLFERFEKVPIASASLAQVHVAYDKETKKKLAVKVQHRGLRETSVGDIYAVTFVVGVIDSLFEDFTFGWIAGESLIDFALKIG
jgi:predicted unusual protein kinase regulating ubiquinone biosynthesis (AarF/ABC1/UbiB family)